MNREELKRYLERIGLDGASAPGVAEVQRAHLAAVPFENLDIVEGRVPLALDEAALFDKIVRRRRGGICYELNLLFAAALRALGHDVALKGGRHPKYGDDMDHLFLLVDGEWLADVGFAANFAEPLRLSVGELQSDGIDQFVIEEAPEAGKGYLRLARVGGGEMFTFGPRTFEPADCRARCDWFSTAPESRFTQGPLVTLQLPDGRRTLSANRFIETRAGVRTETSIESAEQFDTLLTRHFFPKSVPGTNLGNP